MVGCQCCLYVLKGAEIMRISLIQFSIVPGDREANFEQARRHVQAAAADGADIAVLSELWDTSFYPSDVREKADEEGLLAQVFLQDLAKYCNIHIVGGSIARRHERNLYNTTYVVRRDGSLVSSYDKCHLFTPGKEDKAFTAGKELNVFSLDGVTMASIICYDVRFGEWVRMAALAGAKVLFVPAAWPEVRLEHWQLLNRARAIENQFFVAAVNSCGVCGSLQFGGHSLLADPQGTVLIEGGGDDAVLTETIDLSVVDDIRSRINVFRDRRPELYHL